MSWSILSILHLMRYSSCLLSFDVVCYSFLFDVDWLIFTSILMTWSVIHSYPYLTKTINIMSPIRIRRPDDFHVHLRDGNSMV